MSPPGGGAAWPPSGSNKYSFAKQKVPAVVSDKGRY
jgi:hypothetical protein